MKLYLNLKLQSVESAFLPGKTENCSLAKKKNKSEKKITALFKILLKIFNLKINCKKKYLKSARCEIPPSFSSACIFYRKTLSKNN